MRGEVVQLLRHSSCSLRSRSIASFHALTPCVIEPTVSLKLSALCADSCRCLPHILKSQCPSTCARQKSHLDNF